MTTRREERERMRQERLAAQQAASASEKRRLYLGYAVAGVIVVAIVTGIVVAVADGDDDEAPTEGDFPEVAYIEPDIGAVPAGLEPDGRDGTDPPEQANADLEAAAEAASCDLQLNLKEEGNTHFNDPDRVPDYKTNPPTSGDHYAGNENGSGALADGAYLNTPRSPAPSTRSSTAASRSSTPPTFRKRISSPSEGVFEESPQGVIMFPNPDMPYDVAITAWTQLAGCENYEGATTLDVLRTFRDIYRGQGPEFFPLSL